MPAKPEYAPLPNYESEEEIERVLREGTWEELMRLSLGVGRYWPDWRYSQDICLRLAKHSDAAVRANACLAFSYIAQTHGKLDKQLIEEAVTRELRTQEKFRSRIELAIEEINRFMGWQLAKLH